MKEESDNKQDPGSQKEIWRARVAKDLMAYRAEQQQLWGDVDENLLAHYTSGACTEAEKLKVEQAMRDFPAVREAVELTYEIMGAPNDQRKKTWCDLAHRPDNEPGKPR
jgi:hypothetical protein